MLSKFFNKLIQISSTTMPFYAVRVGRNPGVYHTCAVEHLNDADIMAISADPDVKELSDLGDLGLHCLLRPIKPHAYPFYDVPWRNECKAEVDSFPKARYKKFDSEADAEAFVAGTDQPGKKGKEKVDLAEKEIALAKEKLELLEKQKALAVKEQEIEDMKKASSKGPAHKGAGPSKGVASHADKPYSRPFSTSAAKDAKKSKESKKTKLLDIEEVKKLAKETAPAEDSSLGVVVYTDGACCFNGMHGAQGGIGVYWGPDSSWNVSERLKAEGKPTNNRAEIHAVVKAIEQAKERGIKELNVHTDSQFLINSMTKWIHGWKKKGWKLSTGGDVVNKEDFLVLEEASKGIKVNYTHVKGHEGVPGNEAADKLAVAGTKKKPGE